MTDVLESDPTNDTISAQFVIENDPTSDTISAQFVMDNEITNDILSSQFVNLDSGQRLEIFKALAALCSKGELLLLLGTYHIFINLKMPIF
jgi:hypothetical protein